MAFTSGDVVDVLFTNGTVWLTGWIVSGLQTANYICIVPPDRDATPMPVKRHRVRISAKMVPILPSPGVAPCM